ncbi:YsnF/AvaK domain-containing protein, partial [Streptacidiphilus monticola]
PGGHEGGTAAAAAGTGAALGHAAGRTDADATRQQPTVAPLSQSPAAQQPAAAAGGRTAAFVSGGTQPSPLTKHAEPQAGAPQAAAGTAGDAVPEPVEVLCMEERLDITKEWRVLGRARLRKYVTAEQVERRVPVVRERVRVERTPVSDQERAQLTEREIAEAIEEVTLHEERVTARKTVVPVERVRLVVERVTEEQVVREQLRREHIQIQNGEDPQPAGPGRPTEQAPATAKGAGTGQPTAGTAGVAGTTPGQQPQPAAGGQGFGHSTGLR